MLYEVVLRQRYREQLAINRWHYVMTGTPASVSGSFALASAFGVIDSAGVYPEGSIFELMRDSQVAALTYLEAQITALYSVTDFYTRPWSPPLAGLGGGVGTSPVCSIGVQSNRTRADIRRGSKRFSGIPEEDFDAGGVLSTGAVTRYAAIAAAMSAPLTYDDEGNILTFTPVVLSFEPYTTPAGNTAYKQYATLELQEEHMATGIVYAVQTTLRTQTSRQYNRGA